MPPWRSGQPWVAVEICELAGEPRNPLRSAAHPCRTPQARHRHRRNQRQQINGGRRKPPSRSQIRAPETRTQLACYPWPFCAKSVDRGVKVNVVLGCNRRPSQIVMPGGLVVARQFPVQPCSRQIPFTINSRGRDAEQWLRPSDHRPVREAHPSADRLPAPLNASMIRNGTASCCLAASNLTDNTVQYFR
jgi:hypothetical protein